MLGEILKQRRSELALTQQEAAEKLNVTRQTVSSWETCKSYPDIPTLIALSDFYSLSLDYMLKGDEQFMKKLEQDTTELQDLRKMKQFSYVLFSLLPLFGLLMITQSDKDTLLWQIIYWCLAIVTVLLSIGAYIFMRRLHRTNLVLNIGFVFIFISYAVLMLHSFADIPFYGFISFFSSVFGAFFIISGSIKARNQHK